MMGLSMLVPPSSMRVITVGIGHRDHIILATAIVIILCLLPLLVHLVVMLVTTVSPSAALVLY